MALKEIKLKMRSLQKVTELCSKATLYHMLNLEILVCLLQNTIENIGSIRFLTKKIPDPAPNRDSLRWWRIFPAEIDN